MRLPLIGPGRRGVPRECRCGHQARAHEHYRRGSDCALCDCVRYKGATGPFVAGGPPRERLRTAA